jgi:serine protease Do
VIQAIDDETVSSSQQLIRIISQRRPEETVILHYERGSKRLEVEADLGIRPFEPFKRVMEEMDYTNWMGGPLSDQNSGFPEVLQHDLTLHPSECGGPLIDLDGRVVGLNIARAGRTRSYAIPSARVARMVEALDAEKPRLPKSRSLLEEQLEAARAELKAARDAVRRAEEQVEGVEEQLDAAE